MDTQTRATMGAVTTSTKNIAERVVEHLKTIGRPLPRHPDTGYPVIWGVGNSSEHATKRALDFMVTGDTNVGTLICEYLWDRRVEFGLTHFIWRQHIRSTQTSPGVNRPMEDRGSPTNNHMDHVHALFDGRAVKGVSDGGGSTASPKPPTKPSGVPRFPLPRGSYFGPRSGTVASVSGYHGHSGNLKRWQRRMMVRGWSLSADGFYGPETARVVKAFQREKGLTVDGLIGVDTWRAAWTEKVT